jgi:hypothetical protein
MLRPLIGLSAAAFILVGSFAYAQRPQGRPKGQPPAVQTQPINPKVQNQGPGNQRVQPNQNPGWNNWNRNRIWIGTPYWDGWVNPGPVYGGYNSVWFAPYASWIVPISSRAGFGFFYAPRVAIPDVIATVPVEIAGRETGMQITDVFDGGGAKNANMRRGDIILGVGKTRTQSLEELQAALLGVTDTEIVFINKDNNRIEKMPIQVDNGRIGVAVVPVTL